MGMRAPLRPVFQCAFRLFLIAATILPLPFIPGLEIYSARAQYIPPPAAQTFAPAAPVTEAEAAPGRRSPRSRATRAPAAEAATEDARPQRSSRATRAAERRAARAAAKEEARQAAAEKRKAALEAKRAAAARAADARQAKSRPSAQDRKPETSSSFAAPAAGGAGAAAAAAAAAATTGDEQSQPTTSEIVVMAGEANTTAARSIAEVASVIARSGVRVRAELGKISLERLTDPDETKSADLAIMQTDALDEARKSGGPALLRQLNFVARLYNQELHLVAHGSIGSTADLNGRKVALGSPDSPGGRTGRLLLERMGVKAEIVVATQQEAIEQLRRGEVQAAIFVGGKPVPALRDLKIAGLHFLSIPYKGAMQDFYFPAQITRADYPDLVTSNANVDTVAIGTVLVALDARPGTKRYQNLTRFTDAFFDSFPALREAPHHAKWREVNLAADVPGWRRFLPAQRWLDRAPAISDQRMTDQRAPDAVRAATTDRMNDFKSFIQSRPDLGKMPAAEQEKLFKEFQRWNKDTRR